MTAEKKQVGVLISGRGSNMQALIAAAQAPDNVELIALAGFMRLFTPGFVAHWHDRMINIHPSLLPLFPGLDPHGQALAAGVKLHGCTVHLVRDATDSGPIIGQAAIPVLPGDTAESLAARVLSAEHQLYPRCLRLVAEDRIRIEGETAEIAGKRDEDQSQALINPPD